MRIFNLLRALLTTAPESVLAGVLQLKFWMVVLHFLDNLPSAVGGEGLSFAKSDVYNPSVTASPRRPFLASPSGGNWICDEGAKTDEGAGLRDVSEAAGLGQGAI